MIAMGLMEASSQFGEGCLLCLAASQLRRNRPRPDESMGRGHISAFSMQPSGAISRLGGGIMPVHFMSTSDGLLDRMGYAGDFV